MAYPCILRLDLKRFRGFDSLTWYPEPGMNVILGGGDAGKSTLLDAIALLLHPSNSYLLSDADYWQRRVSDEFVIEAVMSLPDATTIHHQRVQAWPWEWDEVGAVLPDADGDPSQRRPVYVLRARGTPDLELIYEIEQPDGSTLSLTTALRKSIGVVRLAGDERSDKDLRLIQGGALDRLLADKTLRAKLGYNIGQAGVQNSVSSESVTKLERLNTSFEAAGLPAGLALGFVGSPGISVSALIGLTAENSQVSLPLISWGSGTKRLSSLMIANALQDGQPITLIDELERGLEPYRQRSLVQKISSSDGQCFITTHSATVIKAAITSSLWYVNASRTIGRLPSDKILAQQKKDPELFLAKFAVVAEGITEVGFLSHILALWISHDWADIGIVVTDAGGNESVLILLEALLSGGVIFGGFADREPDCSHPGRWRQLQEKLGALLLRWDRGCLEENLIPLFELDNLYDLICDPDDEKTGYRLRTLADRLKIQVCDFDSILSASGGANKLRELIIQAACGLVPAGVTEKSEKNKLKSHASAWFKSATGGNEIAKKFLALPHTEERTKVRVKLISFINAIKTKLSMGNVEG